MATEKRCVECNRVLTPENCSDFREPYVCDDCVDAAWAEAVKDACKDPEVAATLGKWMDVSGPGELEQHLSWLEGN